MSKSEHRTRIEFSSLELDVMEDALSYYRYILNDEAQAAEESLSQGMHPDDFMEIKERQRALSNSTNKISKARNRTS